MEPKVNYMRQTEAILDQCEQTHTRPTLLLHACCAPCSSSVLERLESAFSITVLYYNPNIWPQQEYRRRADELAQFLRKRGQAVPLVEDRYDPAEFYNAVRGLEGEPERGARCTVCYRLRMERAAQYAAAHGFDWFCTTLSLSPHKDAERINQIGLALEQTYGVRHLPNDFKKKDGYKRSLELSREYALYRQDYCGCEFSARPQTST